MISYLQFGLEAFQSTFWTIVIVRFMLLFPYTVCNELCLLVELC